MYYYAFIDPESGVCLAIEEHEEPYDNQYYIQLDFYDESLLIRKKYVNGEWVDTTADEAQREQARHIGIDGEWLDERIYRIEGDIANHTHPQYVTGDEFMPFLDIVFAIDADMANKSNVDHIHSEYAAQSDLDVLEDVVATKADSSHTHENYASASHEHSNYATTTDVDALAETVDGKANATHTHSNYATVTAFDTLSAEVDEKADSAHTHSEYVSQTDFNTLESEVNSYVEITSEYIQNLFSV